MFIENKLTLRRTALLALLCLGGCTNPAVDLDSRDHQALLQGDRAIAEQGDTAQEISLSLESAIDRALERNLDARVAAIEVLAQQRTVTLEQLKALPALNASTGYAGRSNDGSSSSRSIQSGLQSLEPSQSTDRNRLTSALELNWNLLDVALAYADAKRADDDVRVAQERHEKVIQNVQRDVYGAYWRAYAHQETRSDTQLLTESAKRQIENINLAVSKKLLSADAAGDQVAMLNDRLRTLKEVDEQLNLADTELKSMLSLPMQARLKLQAPDRQADAYRSLLGQTLETQEWEALKSRPEVREEILQKNLTLREQKREILTTFPGLELFGSANYDTNSFLSDSTWLASSAKLVQSLVSLVTLPSRLEAARAKEDLADARRQALVAAVLAQTSIGRQRLQLSADSYEDSQRAATAAGKRAQAFSSKRDQGLSSAQAALQAQMDRQIEIMRSRLAQAELQDSYAAFMNTLGRRFFRPVELAATSNKGGAT